MSTLELKSSEVLNYLTSNPLAPIYVVEEQDIIMKLVYTKSDEVLVEHYFVPDEEGNPTQKYLSLKFFKKTDPWKAKYKFYTFFGIKNFLESVKE